MTSATAVWGQRIQAARLAVGMTQVQLAEAVGTAQQNISRWESGARAPRYEETRRAVARALGVDVNDLFGYPQDEPNGDEAAA